MENVTTLMLHFPGQTPTYLKEQGQLYLKTDKEDTKIHDENSSRKKCFKNQKKKQQKRLNKRDGTRHKMFSLSNTMFQASQFLQV